MKKQILSGALCGFALLVSACGDGADDATETDVVETGDAATADATGGTTTAASANWPAGTRIVEEGDITYRIDPDGTRVVIEDDAWRIVTEDGVRYRVAPAGTRIRIDDEGLDVDLGDVDVDLGTNQRGNLDLDVSTDGTDASNDRGGDR